MKSKIVFIVIINLFLILGILFLIEYKIYKNAVKEYNIYYKDIAKLVPAPSFIESYRAECQQQTVQYLDSNKKLYIRPFEENAFNIKKPILLFGCSYTHGGMFLNDNQTVSYKLSQLTKRNVYNFGMNACGFQHMLYIIQNRLNQSLRKDIVPEYAIYFYIPNHLQRLQATVYPTVFYNGTILHYSIKNSRLVQEKRLNSFFYKTFIVKSFLYNDDRKRELNKTKDMYDNFALTVEILKESRKQLEKKYPNIKFVIVRYQVENDDSYRELPFQWEVLESLGFIVIGSEDLIGRKFRYNSEDTNEDKYHPSENAWDTLLPPLIEKLNL